MNRPQLWSLSLLYAMISCQGELDVLEPPNPKFIVGEPMNVTCVLDRSTKLSLFKKNVVSAADVFFEVDNKVANRSCTDVVDDSHVTLKCPASADMNKKMVFCYVMFKDRKMRLGSNLLYVGYRPKPLRSTDVSIFNWTRLEIKWEKDVNLIYRTDVSVYWKYLNVSSFQKCTNCSVSAKSQNTENGLCSAQLQNLTLGSKIRFKIIANNTVGKYETTLWTFNAFSKVKLEAVKNVQVVKVSVNWISLVWTPPVFADSITCHTTYRNDVENITHVKSIKIEEKDQLQNQHVVLDNLEAYSFYHIMIMCKSVLGEKWSEPANITVNTKSTVPADVPRVTNGCYFMTRTSKTTRKVTVYWQHVPGKYLRGRLKEYRLRYVDNNQLRTITIPPNDLNYTIEDLNQHIEYGVFIDVSTTVGYNSSAQGRVINIPAISSGYGEDVDMVVKAQDDYSVNIKFTRVSETASNYTIFWCEQANSPTCQTELQWKILPEGKYEHSLRLPEFYQKYQFGFAFEGVNGNQGIHWEDCLYDDRKSPESPDIFDITDITTDSMKIWVRQRGCRYRPKGYVRYYNISWCLAATNKADCFQEGVISRVVHAVDTHVVTITDLEPNTEYRIKAVSIADTGLESYEPDFEVRRTEVAMGGLSIAKISGIVAASTLFLVVVVYGLYSIYRYGHTARRWLTSVAVVEPPSNKNVPIHLEETVDSDIESDGMQPVYPSSDGPYALVAEVQSENDANSYFGEYGRERFLPEGASDSAGYKTCHYTLSPRTRKKFKSRSMKPNQIYMEPGNSIDVNDKIPISKDVTEKKLSTTSSNNMDAINGKDEAGDNAFESDSLLCSLGSNDYPGAWSDNVNTPGMSTESIHQAGLDSDVASLVEECKIHDNDSATTRSISPEKQKSRNDDIQKVSVERDAPRLDMNQDLDWSSDDDDIGDGYKKRANKIEQYFVEDTDTEEDSLDPP